MSSGYDFTRRRFLQIGGVGVLAALATACSDILGRDPEGELGEGTVDGSVIVVGAGPAGMTAAHLLQQRGADVRVIEALSTHGGRIAHDTDFADFPISLGGEWIHVDPSVLDDIVADDSVDIETVVVAYQEDDPVASWDEDGVLTTGFMRDVGVDPDLKFGGSSWLDFFETYIVPGIAPLITYDTAIERVEYGAFGVRLTDRDGGVREADRVVVTVPVKILQLGLVEFDPPLPDSHVDSIADAEVWSGFKAFIEFDEQWFPTSLAPPDAETDGGQRLYYDAAYGQTTGEHILGLFSVGEQAERYQAAGDGAIDLILAELDAVYDGAASASYLRHITQNWNDQPFARAAYLTDNVDHRLTRRMSESVDDRVLFAGDGYTKFDDWSSVHAAAWSARDAVREILG